MPGRQGGESIAGVGALDQSAQWINRQVVDTPEDWARLTGAAPSDADWAAAQEGQVAVFGPEATAVDAEPFDAFGTPIGNGARVRTFPVAVDAVTTNRYFGALTPGTAHRLGLSTRIASVLALTGHPPSAQTEAAVLRLVDQVGLDSSSIRVERGYVSERSVLLEAFRAASWTLLIIAAAMLAWQVSLDDARNQRILAAMGLPLRRRLPAALGAGVLPPTLGAAAGSIAFGLGGAMLALAHLGVSSMAGLSGIGAAGLAVTAVLLVGSAITSLCSART